MQGYIPYSDDFLFQDPEMVDQYREWQRFAKFLSADQAIRLKKKHKQNHCNLSLIKSSGS